MYSSFIPNNVRIHEEELISIIRVSQKLEITFVETPTIRCPLKPDVSIKILIKMKILKVGMNKETCLRNDCILVASRTAYWGDG